MRLACVVLWLSVCGTALAQDVPEYRADEVLALDRTEAWAMNYLASAALPIGAGPPGDAAPGEWRLIGELGHNPSLDADQRLVGLDGTKREDLNKSPVFGRLRADVALPAHLRLELGWTPPVAIGGSRPRSLFATALAWRVVARDPFALGVRVFGQHGHVSGDFTCPEEIVGLTDPELNPYGCEARSNDRYALRQYGAEVEGQWRRGGWQWLGSAGAVRNELEVQVDAITFGVHDLSRLTANHWRPFFSVGARRELGSHWAVAAHWVHVPLPVRRPPDTEREHDDFDAMRFQLEWRVGK
jgi:hypothetical protein